MTYDRLEIGENRVSATAARTLIVFQVVNRRAILTL